MKQNISIVIPTYNGVELLKKNLRQVIDAARDGDEIILVDDASCDETVAWLQATYSLKEHPFIQKEYSVPQNYFLEKNQFQGYLFSSDIKEDNKTIHFVVFVNKDNQRFGATVNIGVLLTRHVLVFLCNNDVIPEKNCFDEAIKMIETSENTFAVGCLEYLHSKSGEKSGKNKLWFARGLFQHSKASDFNSGETAWASGGSAVFDKEKWLTLGGFDRAYYPAYWEDIDLSFRARKIGWKILFNADAVVYHKHESTNSAVFGQEKISFMSWKNAFTFTLKNGTISQKLQYFVWLPYWLLKIFFPAK